MSFMDVATVGSRWSGGSTPNSRVAEERRTRRWLWPESAHETRGNAAYRAERDRVARYEGLALSVDSSLDGLAKLSQV